MGVKKKSTVFRCSSCGHDEPKWLGRCPACGEWNTLRETSVADAKPPAGSGSGRYSVPLAAIDPGEGERFPSGIGELDRVLGGGVMPGSAVLVGGEPGIGKSTLLLQLAARARTKGRVLYVSGEESAAQLRLRADRLGLARDNLEVLCTGEVESILETLDRVKPVLVVADSAQTLRSEEAGSVPGTVNQIKYGVAALSDWAKSRGAALFVVAHVTKEGTIAGPKAVEHLVDTVLYFEQNDADARFLRATKNRFGSTDELGIFTMGAKGLAELPDPSSLFLTRRDGALPPGAAVAALWEGSRCLLVEVQALVAPAKSSLTRVYADRVDSQRVARIAAILERWAGMRFSDQDLYVNVAGGVKVAEPGADLAIAAALWSARSGIALPEGAALAGELSLAGEVRPVRRLRSRAKAASGLGFAKFVGPADGGDRDDEGSSAATPSWTRSATLKEALRALFGADAARRTGGERPGD